MSEVAPRLRDVAGLLSQQASRMLGAPAFVVDSDHRVVAASRPGWIGRFVRGSTRERAVEVPLKVGEEYGWMVMGRPSDGGNLPAHLVQALVDLLVDQAAFVGTLQQGPELKNKIIHDLLRGQGSDEETLVRQARLLGMDLAPPRAVILIDARRFLGTQGGVHDSNDDYALRAQKVIDVVVAFFQLPSDTICAHIGDGEIAVLKASDTRNLSDWANEGDVAAPASWANLAALKRAVRALLKRLQAETGVPLSIGVGRYHRGPGGLARSYQDARVALALGVRMNGPDRIHSLDKLGITAFVGVPDERTKVELATNLLGPLDGDPELLETLDAYFRHDCRPGPTAQELGVHRNTLNYRLGKVALTTGLDPRIFDQAVQIRLALVLRSLHQSSSATIDQL